MVVRPGPLFHSSPAHRLPRVSDSEEEGEEGDQEGRTLQKGDAKCMPKIRACAYTWRHLAWRHLADLGARCMPTPLISPARCLKMPKPRVRPGPVPGAPDLSNPRTVRTEDRTRANQSGAAWRASSVCLPPSLPLSLSLSSTPSLPPSLPPSLSLHLARNSPAPRLRSPSSDPAPRRRTNSRGPTILRVYERVRPPAGASSEMYWIYLYRFPLRMQRARYQLAKYVP